MGDMVDNEAVDQLIRLQFAHAQSIPHDALALIRDRMAMGHGAYPLIGTPEQVTEGLIEIHRAGFSGSTFSFFDYNDDFPYFRDTVLPNLVQAGLRRSEEHTSELQSLMRISYAVFCLKKTTKTHTNTT